MANREDYNYDYTNTDFMPDIFANSDKLVSTERRQYFDKQYNYDNDNDNYNNDNNYENYGNQNDNRSEKEDRNDNKYESEHYGNYKEGNDDDDNYKNNRYAQTENMSQTEQDDPDDETKWDRETLFKRKLDMIKKLGELKQAGVKLSTNYNMNSNYRTMKFEYELHKNIRAKAATVNWLGGMTIGMVRGIELLNDNVNPFDMKFDDAWSKSVASNITDYYEVLGDIYEKYHKPGEEWAPEIKLLMLLLTSAFSIQFHKGALNNLNTADEIDNNQEMIRQLSEKAKREKANLEKEREQAYELARMKHKEQEYNELLKRTQNQNMTQFQNSFQLSESIKSRDNNSILSDLKVKNQHLQQINNILKDLDDTETKSKKSNKSIKSIKSNKIKPIIKENTDESSQSSKSSKSSKSSDLSESSTSSSRSRISINPDMAKLLESKRNTMKNEDGGFTIGSISFSNRSGKNSNRKRKITVK